MKRVLKASCIKCGSTIWYVYRSGRRCVQCAHNRALTGRAMIRSLEKELAASNKVLRLALKALEGSYGLSLDDNAQIAHACIALRERLGEA